MGKTRINHTQVIITMNRWYKVFPNCWVLLVSPTLVTLWFPKMGGYPQILHLRGNFLYKPSILGVSPHFRKPPHWSMTTCFTTTTPAVGICPSCPSWKRRHSPPESSRTNLRLAANPRRASRGKWVGENVGEHVRHM